MTPGEKQSILDNAPPGATHFDVEFGNFYKLDARVFYWCEKRNLWDVAVNLVGFSNSISLESLRDPAEDEVQLTERERILYDAIDAISSMCFEDYDYDYARAFSACQDAADNALSKFEGMESEHEPQHYFVVTALSAGIEHETLEKAENSAKHYAVKNPGMRVYVCAAVGAYCAKIEVDQVK